MNRLSISRCGLLAVVASTAILFNCTRASAQTAGWSGNMLRNPGFEEDFVNANSESHVLSFKGDWYYNQKDLVPDYWTLTGAWTWQQQTPHAGRYTLKLAEGATAAQTFMRAVSQHGGGAWGGAETPPIPLNPEDTARFAQPWKASAWCRGGGSIKLACGGDAVEAKSTGGAAWELLAVELPADKVGAPSISAVLTLVGPGEFDDVVIEERLATTPNLVANGNFEALNKEGYPIGWSKQQKYRAIGPTYYVWTDWNHYFSENRGGVIADPLVMRTGKQSLRFNVFPGDEKLVESDLIVLNQTQPKVIEVGVYVRADRVNLIDIGCVDAEGVHMPGYRARQPEYKQGGTFLYGNGTFEWRYIRKFFATPRNEPVKGIRVRLCARGMNGHTLDDAGTRSYCMQTGTVWWDDLTVTERTSTAAELTARGVKVPAAAAVTVGAIEAPELDLGQRLFGQNSLSYSFGTNAAGSYQLSLTTTLPGGKPVKTTSPAMAVAAGKRGTLTAPYSLTSLAGELDKQGTLAVELLRDGKPVGQSTYSFNTWPVIVDIDVSRHYNLPAENPVTTSLNLGVSDLTLAQVKNLELQLYRASDKKVLASQSITNLPQAFAATIAALPKAEKDSYEFNLPTPAWWVDRTNLIITKLDLAALKTWPHDNPVRDTVLIVRGLDAAGKELFRTASDPFCRMEHPPKQPPIDKVAVREDGVVLINGVPKYLTGATHQHQRLAHTMPIIAQLGLMGHRLVQGHDAKFENVAAIWNDFNLYALQIKPISGQGGTEVVVDLTPEQRQALQSFVAAGGMKNVVSVNTGGWEAAINVADADAVAKHAAVNDFVRQVTGRPTAISTSGAYNAWWIPKLTFYDINHAETEMWGPMDFNVIFTPYMKKARKSPTTWVYLPQLYDNTPYERYRFETYENIIRGSAGVSMIQGIGDATFNRGLAGELRYLESRLTSLEPPAAVTLEPSVSHKVARQGKKTYVLATNAGPIAVGNWKWNTETKHSGKASHEGDSANPMWFRPGGVRIHGFRGMSMPLEIKSGDKIVQYVWLDPAETPEWVMLAVRGDGRFAHNAVLGNFNFDAFKKDYGNILMYSELNHSVWHEINWVMDDATYQRAVKVIGKAEADTIKKGADAGRETVDKVAYKAEHFHNLGALPKAGAWTRIELDADKAGLTGKLVDGVAWLTKNGRALWDYTVVERGGKVERIYCEDSIGIDRALLKSVKVSVPGLKKGTKVVALFEDREIIADDGGFTDNFEGVDTYGYEAGAITGDLFGFVKDPDRELARMMPSGHGYSYGPTAVHIYEIPTE